MIRTILIAATAAFCAAEAHAHDGHGAIDPTSLLHFVLEHGVAAAVLVAVLVAAMIGMDRVRRRRR